MVQRWPSRVLVGAAMLLAPSACSLLVTTAGLSAGQGPTVDASSEESAPDAGADAPVDGEAGADANGPFCKGRTAAFCADFDGDDLFAGWTGQATQGGTFARASDAVGAPFAMRATVDAAPGTSDNAARLFWTTATIPSAVHLEVDVRFDAQSSGLYEPLKIEFPTTFESDRPGQLSAAMELFVDRGGPMQLTVEGWDDAAMKYRTTYPGSVTPVAGAWSHVVVDTALAASNGSVRATIDGAPTVDVKGIRTLSAEPTAVRIVVGQYVYGTSSSTVISYDNVLVTVTP